MIKSKKQSRTVSKHSQTNESGRDTAIRDAEQEILILARQKVRLEQALRIFHQNKKEDVKCPMALRKKAQ